MKTNFLLFFVVYLPKLNFMKTSLLKAYALVLMSILCSCSQSEPHDEIVVTPRYNVSFHLKPAFEVQPFSGDRAIPSGVPNEPDPVVKTNEPQYSNEPFFSRIEYALYNAVNGKLIKNALFVDNDTEDDFGTYLYDKLEEGEYIVAILAHSIESASFVNGEVSGDDVGDAFYSSAEFEVKAINQDTPIELALRRIVSCVEFVATDDVPPTAINLTMEVSGRYTSFEMQDGNTTQPTALTRGYALEAGSKTTYAFYTFVPLTTQEGDTCHIESIQLTTLDIDNETIQSISLQNIPIIRNKVTRYTGNLYTKKKVPSTLELEIENHGEWEDPIEKELP